MNFAIEAPAEANPLTEGTLYHVLQSAASSNPHQIQTGSKQLQKWETDKGYYPLLQLVFLDRSLPLEIRYLAIIQLKNGIDKYWRKTAPNAVNRDDRQIIRSKLLEGGVQEADHRLALQNALVVAKIVRYEYPMDWPDVITNIIALLRSSSTLDGSQFRLPRILLMLLYIVKELSTGRLQRTRTSLLSVTPEILQVLGQIYFAKVRRWRSFIQSGGDDEGGAIEDIEQSLLAIKTLRRLINVGYDFPQREKEVQEFWELIRLGWEDFLQLYEQTKSQLSSDVSMLLQKHILQISKLHLQMAKQHPSSFVMLPNSILLTQTYWRVVKGYGETYASQALPTQGDGESEEHKKPFMEQLCLKALSIIRACLKMVFNPAQTFKYRHAQEKEEKAQSIQKIKTELLTEQAILDWMENIISYYFVLRPMELAEWEQHPEEWESKEQGDVEDYEFSIRPCSERLFLDLIINYRETLVGPLLQAFNSVSSPDTQDVLRKDALYAAIGLAAPAVHSHLDLDNFIVSTLVPEVQNQQSSYKILRRRNAILLGQWISVKVSETSRPIVYQIFQHLLNKDDPFNDLVVRITAGRQLRNIAAEWEFKAEHFLPMAPDTLSRLMALIEEVEMTDTKMSLLNTISTIVERLDHNITPYADRIVSLLPPLWEQSGEEHLMKQAVLTILCRLIVAMKTGSRRFHPLFLPIIEDTIRPESETQVYLLEDALDLWSSIIAQTPSSECQPLLPLMTSLFAIYELGTDTLRKALEITESYVLLAPSAMLGPTIQPRLLTSLVTLLSTLKRGSVGLVTNIVELLIRAAEGLGASSAVETLAGNMINIGLAEALLHGLHDAWEVRNAIGPRRRDSVVEGVVETDYFAVFARLAYLAPNIFIVTAQTVTASAAWMHKDASVSMASEPSAATALEWLLNEWFLHFEYIGSPTRRKLMCLALTRLLGTGAPWMLAKLQDLMILWTDVVIELREGSEDKSQDNLLFWDADRTKPSELEAPEEERKRDLGFSDPVHSVNMNVFIHSNLRQAIDMCGGEAALQRDWVVNVDRDVLEAFGKLGIM